MFIKPLQFDPRKITLLSESTEPSAQVERNMIRINLMRQRREVDALFNARFTSFATKNETRSARGRTNRLRRRKISMRAIGQR